MTELDTRLQRAFAADVLPAADPLFRVQVIVRRQREALRRRLLDALGFASISALLAVLALQSVDEVVESNSVRLALIGIVAIAYVVIVTCRYLGVPLFVHVLSARIRSLIT